MYIFVLTVENHIMKVSFCFKFQKAVKPKRPKKTKTMDLENSLILLTNYHYLEDKAEPFNKTFLITIKSSIKLF